MVMTERRYDLLTRGAVVIGVVSALTFDRTTTFRWIPVLLGAVAGVTAVSTYFYNQLCLGRKSSVAAQSSSSGEMASNISYAEEPDSLDHPTYAVLLRAHHSAYSASNLDADLLDYLHRDNMRLWHVPHDAAVIRRRVFHGAFEVARRPRDIVEEVVQIATRLASDRFEVVVTTHGQIIVRPAGATPRASAEQRELSFTEPPGDRPDRPGGFVN